jgi:hypothetical protein
MKTIKAFFKKLGHCYKLMKADFYTIVLTDRQDEDIQILFNCCVSCAADRLDYGLTVLEEIESDELDQEDAVDLANRIINNKN